MRRRPALATILVLAALVTLAACGESGPAPASTPAPAPASAPAPTSSPASPSGDGSPSEAVSPPASPPAGGVVRDDTLLSILPPDLDGVAVVAEEESFAEAAADPEFAAHVARAAFAIIATPTDLASGVVAQLDAGVFDDTFFRDWRETYNEGACAQAGGVVGIAEAELDGRTVYIATCEGGLRVYHAYVEERGVLVSLFSLGEGRYGERLVADLRQ